MATLDDILTTQKNGVVAINGLLSKFGSILDQVIIIANGVGGTFPAKVTTTVAASTTYQAVVGSGKLISVSIPVHAGSAQIYVYDSATVGGISATNLLYASLPSNAATFTPYQNVLLPYTNGLVMKTEAGMNFCVGYTPN